MQSLGKGLLKKMANRLDGVDRMDGLDQTVSTVAYDMRLGDASYPLNGYLGQTIKLQYSGAIQCQHCGRKTKKSFNQGYCYPCFKSLASCDLCIMSPERCHYDEGTCRQPDWGADFCMQPHIVYLANSSNIKVGITRVNQIPVRWIDQGAIQAIPVMSVNTRQQSGFVEVAFKQHVSDRTSWQAMLKHQGSPIDMVEKRDELLDLLANDIRGLQDRFGLQAIHVTKDAAVVTINYPVLNYPEKVKSMNLDKQPVVEGQLQGIKGQYMIFDVGVINIRKYTSYEVELFV